MNSKLEVFSVLVLGIMVLLISITSIVTAQQYDPYYEDNRQYIELDRGYNDDYYKDEYVYEDEDEDYYPVPKHKQVLCESGLFANSYENCPVKCDNGLYVMQGAECPKLESTAKLTVNKEIYGCENIIGDDRIECLTLLNDDAGWMLCDELVNNVQGASTFCNPLDEGDFDIKVSDINENLIDPPGQFEGSIDGTMIMDLEPGTYNVNEIIHISFQDQLGESNVSTNSCMTNNFVDGGAFVDTASNIVYSICFEYEDENGNDCNLIDLEAGDDKTCTVKNHILFGRNNS